MSRKELAQGLLRDVGRQIGDEKIGRLGEAVFQTQKGKSLCGAYLGISSVLAPTLALVS